MELIDFRKIKRNIENTGEQTSSGIGNFFSRSWRNLGNLGLGILETFPKLFVAIFNFFGNILVNTFNNIYNTKVSEKKGHQISYNFCYCFNYCCNGFNRLNINR